MAHRGFNAPIGFLSAVYLAAIVVRRIVLSDTAYEALKRSFNVASDNRLSGLLGCLLSAQAWSEHDGIFRYSYALKSLFNKE